MDEDYLDEYKVSDYSIYDDARQTAGVLTTELDSQIEIVNNASKILKDPTVFAGPIAEECYKAVDILQERVDLVSSNFKKVGNYFAEVHSDYEKGDENACLKIIGFDDKGEIVVEKYNPMDKLVKQLIEMGLGFANDSRFGYGRGGYGPNSGNVFDCGGLVWYLLNNVYGLNYNTLQGISPYMLANQLPNYGFQKINTGGPVDVSQLKPGDILINPSTTGGHAAIYIGNGQILEARWNYDGISGDSSGDEISVNDYYGRIYNSGAYNFNYNTIIRLQGWNGGNPVVSA